MTSVDQNLLADLEYRGLIFQRTHEDELQQALQQPITLYCGFDPSASSMQVGNLLMIIALARFRRAGHHPIALSGGATGQIGDPSGKSAERTLLSSEVILANTKAIGQELRTILDRAMTMHRDNETVAEPIPIVNNADWITPFSFLDFLRDVGKHVRVNTMLSRDSVKSRLENRDQGISYTEFSYQLIQAYDFYHLYKTHNCLLQIGGSDQWGNLVSGTDLIRRIADGTAFGLTLPLVTDASGKKFGKSEGNAVYLNRDMTSPYLFYQFWLNQDDAIVIDLLKKYTFLSHNEIDNYQVMLNEGKNRGDIQKRLAYELTHLVHGQEEADAVVKSSQMLFGERIEGLTEATLKEIFAEVPSYEIKRDRLEAGIPLVDLFAEAFDDSKSSVQRLLKQGGCYINNERISDKSLIVTHEHLTTPTKIVLRSGRKKYCLIDIKE